MPGSPESTQSHTITARDVVEELLQRPEMKALQENLSRPAAPSPITANAGEYSFTVPERGFLAENKHLALAVDSYHRRGKAKELAGLEVGAIIQASYLASKRKCPVEEVLAAAPDGDYPGLGMKALADVVKGAKAQAKSISGVLTGVEFSDGGAWVPVELLRGYVDVLTAQLSVFRAPVTEVTITSDTASLGKLTGTTSAEYLSPSGQPAVSAPTTGSMVWVLKRLANATSVNQRWATSVTSLDAMMAIRNRLLGDFLLKKNLQALRGTGEQFAPKGLRSMVLSAHVGAFTGTKTTYADVYAWLLSLTGFPADANVPMDSFYWVLSDKMKRALFTLTRGDVQPFQDAMVEQGTLLGYPFIISNQQPNDLGVGGDETEITFFRAPNFWSAQGPVMQFKSSDSAAYPLSDGTMRSAWSAGEVVMQVEGWHDFQLEHDESVAVGTGYTPDFV